MSSRVTYLDPGLEAELRALLAQRLPAYMVPSRFIFLDRLPTTPNGKIDPNALQQMAMALPLPQAAYLPPRTPQEAALAHAMQAVLGLGQVGMKDDFFALGGDSIKAIQIISELAKLDWKVEMGEIFHHPVVEELALLLQPATVQVPQGKVVGSLPLSPIQRWMVAHYAATAHHYNQAVLLQMRTALDVGHLRTALEALQAHHDGLRTTFRFRDSKVEATVQDLPFPVQMDVFPQGTDLERTSAALQAQVDLENGPLLRVAVFEREEGDRLLLILHHLVADGLSWRVLLQDLALAYQQLVSRQGIQLPAKTHSFRDWTHALEEFAESGMKDVEYKYWLRQDHMDVALLPVDFPGDMGTEGDRAVVSRVLPAEFTRSLLQDAQQAYHTEINDLLVAALGLALQEWTGAERVAIQMEGHGREDIGAGLEIGRTVGWFTTHYPLVLDVSQHRVMGAYIKAVKEQLRQVPRKGLGHGVLKYMHAEGNPFTSPLPQLEFNYLGQFDADLDASLFAAAPEEPGPVIAQEAPLLHGLSLNGMVLEGKLRMSLGYSRRCYRAATAETLLDRFLASLEAVVAHCTGKATPELTPSDLTIDGISLEELQLLEHSVEEL